MSHPAATADFWAARWARNEIGFHEGVPNAWLQQFWPTLGLPAGARVLVPLCGKTHDLHWLAAQGFEVVGVELSAVACAAFFAEAGVEPSQTVVGPFTAWAAGGITIYQGDIFDLPLVEPLHRFAAVWDRAAYIALPPEVRARYATLRVEGPRLLVTFTYDPTRRDGPPFSIPAEEVPAAFGGAELLAQAVLNEPRWADIGGATERIWRVRG